MRYGFEPGASRRRPTPIRYSLRQTRRVQLRMAGRFHPLQSPSTAWAQFLGPANALSTRRSLGFFTDQATQLIASLADLPNAEPCSTLCQNRKRGCPGRNWRDGPEATAQHQRGDNGMLTAEMFRSPSGVPGHRAPPAHGDEPDPEAVPHADLRPQ